MPQDCCPVPARRHMTVLEIPLFRRGDPQLRGKVAQDIGLDIARPGRKSRPRSEEAQLKSKPDPAGTIDPPDQSGVIKGQAPNLRQKTVPNRHPPNNARNSLPSSSCPVNRQFVHGVFSQMSTYARSGLLGLSHGAPPRSGRTGGQIACFPSKTTGFAEFALPCPLCPMIPPKEPAIMAERIALRHVQEYDILRFLSLSLAVIEADRKIDR